jgi:arsenical pump membrane protein
MPTALALLLLVLVLGFAVVRPRRLPEVVVAVPAAVLALAFHLVSVKDALDELRMLGPTVGFLAAVLVLAQLADSEGVFAFAGQVAARWSRGSARRLLAVVFAIASVVTVVLSLDATVVLLTPVVFATAATVHLRPRPHVYACAHLANTASLLLPVSNLTNLLAFAATGLTFWHFAGLMTLPWLAAITVEYLVFRRYFRADLSTPARAPEPQAPRTPWLGLSVLAATLFGFGLSTPLGIAPAWIAAAGALTLAAIRLVRPAADPAPTGEPARNDAWTIEAIGGVETAEEADDGTASDAKPGDAGTRSRRTTWWKLLVSANPGFLAFVFGLGVVVLAVRRSAAGDLVARIVPHRADPLGLLLAAALAAVLANLLNNLPATLVLVPLMGHSPGLVLAVLLGVNIGPNLTYVGSLATLLWRQILHERDHPPDTRDFLTLGALTVPAALVAGVGALWLGLLVIG